MHCLLNTLWVWHFSHKVSKIIDSCILTNTSTNDIHVQRGHAECTNIQICSLRKLKRFPIQYYQADKDLMSQINRLSEQWSSDPHVKGTGSDYEIQTWTLCIELATVLTRVSAPGRVSWIFLKVGRGRLREWGALKHIRVSAPPLSRVSPKT